MRRNGMLLPIASLPSPYGIGAFSKEAYEFIDKNTDNPGYIKLPALFSKTDAEKVSYRKKIQKTLTSLTEDEETLFETRFDKLCQCLLEQM